MPAQPRTTYPIPLDPTVRAALVAVLNHSSEGIGQTDSREGDIYQQALRDLSAGLLGVPPLPDHMGVGTLADGLEGAVVPLLTAPPRPSTVCQCSLELIWVSGRWEHNAAPSLVGTRHGIRVQCSISEPPVGEAREFWDREDDVADN